MANHPIRRMILAIALLGTAPAPVAAADRGRPAPSGFAAGRTGKERLSDKGSDEQRMDDCKVPPARRTRARPTACPWDAGS